jgi:catalase (peroxidase I)
MGFPFRNWDNSPVRFDSQYFDFVLSKGIGPPDWDLVVEPDPTRPGEEIRWFEPSSRGGWLMLPTDLMLRDDEALRVHSEEFYADEGAFHAAFADAFKQVTELGFMFREGSDTKHGRFDCGRALQLRGGSSGVGGGRSGGCPFAGRGK